MSSIKSGYSSDEVVDVDEDIENDIDDLSSDALPSQLGFHDTDDALGQNAFAATAFDQFFQQNHKPPRTSSNVFSDLLPPLTAQEYVAAIANTKYARPLTVPWLKPACKDRLFQRLLFELEEGFNLLFYGAGSKRNVLNAFATHLSGDDRDVLVINAFNPSFAVKDLLTSIEGIPAIQEYDSTSAGVGPDAQIRPISKFFASPDTDMELYIVIHNIDAPSLRSTRARSYLSSLASQPRIHMLASVDNVAFPNLWSLSDIFTRKSHQSSTTPAEGVELTSRGGYAWLFHDLTTLAPYDFELAYADRSSISGASQASVRSAQRSQKESTTGGPSASALMTEEAARHILLSVTVRAKKLFVLLGTKQLEAMSASSGKDKDKEKEGTGAAITDPAQIAFDYGMLFNMARDDFVATNDTALRALMGEFKDHGLMVSIAQGLSGSEAVWIPLRKDALTKIIADLKKQ